MSSVKSFILCLVFIMSSVKGNLFNQGRHLKSSVVNASLQTLKISSIPDNRNFITETLQNATKFKRETTCGIGERQCPYRNEKTGKYTCFRSCQRCDGVVDCPRATDEEGCPCRSKIPSRYICDGSPDCSDFSDELGCGECMQDELQCGGGCISISDFCTKKSCPRFSRSLFCSRLNLKPFDYSDETNYRSEGYLQMRVRNKWLPVCGTLSLQSQVVVNQYCLDVTGVRDAKHAFKLEELPTKSSLWSELLVIEDFVFASQAESCIQNMVIYVNCALPKCQNKREIHEQTTHHKIIERIVGGNDAIEGDWRFLVRIIKNGEHNCGGSILTSRWILSASHCFLKISGETYEVESGSGRTGIYGPNVQKRLVSHVIRHEDFDPYSMANDVALIRLLTPLQFNRWTRPTCFLDNKIHIEENSTCFLAGWGYQTEDGNLAETLQEIPIPILDGKECIKEFYYVEPQKVICAGHEKGKKDSCQGDSGGPMMCGLCNTQDHLDSCDDEEWAQAAIVSYGRGCARPGVPGVYTKVEYFKDWIFDTVASMEDDSVKLPEIVPKTICDGLQCFHTAGLCLNSSKICDNKVDCLKAEDELNCDMRIVSLPFNSSKSINNNNNDDNKDDNNDDNSNDNNSNDSNNDNDKNANNEMVDYDYKYENEIEIKNVSTTCPENHYRCEIIPGCIPNSLLCDETRNCRDGTDELRCTCVDRIYLTNRNKICDGFYDCPDYSDEFCDLCKNGKWLCRRSFQCISRDKICDAFPDCRYGEDELNCLALTPNEGELVLDREGNPQYSNRGIILLYSSSSSSWDPICEHEMDQDIAIEICTYLGFSSPLSIKYNANLPSTYKIRQESARKKRFISFPDPRHDFRSSGRGLTVNGVQLENFKGAKEEEEKEDEESLAADFGNVFPHRKMIGNSKTGRTRRMACNQVQLECGERICGKVQSLHFSNAPPLADASHVPWAVGIYKSGKYLCGGTIVDLQWVLTFSRCLNNLNLLRDEIHVLGGSNRGLSTTPFMGPNEIDIRIDAIVEVEKGEGVILLHLEKSISLFESLNAICWDDRSNITWKECLVVGPYKGNLNHAFLLSPKEDCEENKFCFETNIPFDQICSNSWSSLITCREERKSNSPWTAVAIRDFREKGSCSELLNSFKVIPQDLREKIQRKMDEPIQSRTSLRCDTHKCPLGICIPSDEMCNAKIACPDMSDEPFECPVPVTVCTYFNSTSCECPHDDFKCSDGLCIESVKICDGVAHCANGEDEKNCTCSVILTSLKEKRNCNGIIDCGDESDELHCGCDIEKEFRCFRSSEQECISRLVVCDAVPDCSSGEDEAFCLTISSTFFPEENALGIPSSSSKGYLLLRIKGKWYTYANQIWTATNSQAVCKSLGYKDVFKTEQKLINQSLFKARAQEILPVMNTSQNEIVVIFIDCIV